MIAQTTFEFSGSHLTPTATRCKIDFTQSFIKMLEPHPCTDSRVLGHARLTDASASIDSGDQSMFWHRYPLHDGIETMLN